MDDPTCNNQNAGLTLSRAESLEDALAGRYTYRDLPPTTLLGGTNTSHPCANWEGNNIWVDENGWFHSLAHAFRGQPTTYPVPGCVERRGVTQQCTASAGHSYSMDGKTWCADVPPFHYFNRSQSSSSSSSSSSSLSLCHLLLDRPDCSHCQLSHTLPNFQSLR